MYGTIERTGRLLVDREVDRRWETFDHFHPIDGRYVMRDRPRSEESVLSVIESTTGKVLSDSIDRANSRNLPGCRTTIFSPARRNWPPMRRPRRNTRR
jgi:hypothetical protein